MASRKPSSSDLVGLAPRGKAAKVVIYPEAWQAVRLGMALGLYALAAVIWDDASARAPKSSEQHRHMAQTGGAGAYLDGRKVAGVGPGTSSAVAGARPTAFVSFEFPAHLVELGTINMGAQPFLTPAAFSNLSSAPEYIAEGLRKAGI